MQLKYFTQQPEEFTKETGPVVLQNVKAQFSTQCNSEQKEEDKNTAYGKASEDRKEAPHQG